MKYSKQGEEFYRIGQVKPEPELQGAEQPPGKSRRCRL